MKTYDQLTAKEQTSAVDRAVETLLGAIVEGAVRFNDGLNRDDLQARIDLAFAECERLQTPWFAGEAIMETCADDIRSMAQCDAEDALYPGPSERVVTGVNREV